MATRAPGKMQVDASASHETGHPTVVSPLVVKGQKQEKTFESMRRDGDVGLSRSVGDAAKGARASSQRPKRLQMSSQKTTGLSRRVHQHERRRPSISQRPSAAKIKRKKEVVPTPQALRFEWEGAEDSEPYYLQGDDAFDTEEALAMRRALKKNKKIQEEIERFYGLYGKDANGMIDKDNYLKVHSLIAKTLVPNLTLEDAMDVGEEDWESDCKGHAVLDFPLFFSSIFEVADVWCQGIDASEYVMFLRKLFSRIAYKTVTLEDGSVWRGDNNDDSFDNGSVKSISYELVDFGSIEAFDREGGDVSKPVEQQMPAPEKRTSLAGLITSQNRPTEHDKLRLIEEELSRADERSCMDDEDSDSDHSLLVAEDSDEDGDFSSEEEEEEEEEERVQLSQEEMDEDDPGRVTVSGPRVVIMGKPGVGRTTIGSMLAHRLGNVFISKIDILREAMEQGTGMGQDVEECLRSGGVVPENLISHLMKTKLQGDKVAFHGYVLDDFPSFQRDMESLVEWERQPTYVVDLHLSDTELGHRRSGIRLDPLTNAIHTRFAWLEDRPPGIQSADLLPHDVRDRLIQRPQDTPDGIATSLADYQARVRGVIPGLLSSLPHKENLLIVDATHAPEEIIQHIISRMEHQQGVPLPERLPIPPPGVKEIDKKELYVMAPHNTSAMGRGSTMGSRVINGSREMSKWGRFDPVLSQSQSGSGALVEGQKELAVSYMGKVYYFATEESMQQFQECPPKYLSLSPTMPQVRLQLAGPRLAGRTQQSKLMSKYYGVPRVNMEEELQREVSAGTELGRNIKASLDSGLPVEPGTLAKVVAEAVRRQESDSQHSRASTVLSSRLSTRRGTRTSGFILDGFPYTQEQAIALEKANLMPDKIVHLNRGKTQTSSRSLGGMRGQDLLSSSRSPSPTLSLDDSHHLTDVTTGLKATPSAVRLLGSNSLLHNSRTGDLVDMDTYLEDQGMVLDPQTSEAVPATQFFTDHAQIQDPLSESVLRPPSFFKRYNEGFVVTDRENGQTEIRPKKPPKPVVRSARSRHRGRGQDATPATEDKEDAEKNAPAASLAEGRPITASQYFLEHGRVGLPMGQPVPASEFTKKFDLVIEPDSGAVKNAVSYLESNMKVKDLSTGTFVPVREFILDHGLLRDSGTGKNVGIRQFVQDHGVVSDPVQNTQVPIAQFLRTNERGRVFVPSTGEALSAEAYVDQHSHVLDASKRSPVSSLGFAREHGLVVDQKTGKTVKLNTYLRENAVMTDPVSLQVVPVEHYLARHNLVLHPITGGAMRAEEYAQELGEAGSADAPATIAVYLHEKAHVTHPVTKADIPVSNILRGEKEVPSTTDTAESEAPNPIEYVARNASVLDRSADTEMPVEVFSKKHLGLSAAEAFRVAEFIKYPRSAKEDLEQQDHEDTEFGQETYLRSVNVPVVELTAGESMAETFSVVQQEVDPFFDPRCERISVDPSVPINQLRFGDFKNFCPVSLQRNSSLVPGKREFAALVKGRLYLFAGEEEREYFMRNPRVYMRKKKKMSAPPPRVGILGAPSEWRTSLMTAISNEFTLPILNLDAEMRAATPVSWVGETGASTEDPVSPNAAAVLRASLSSQPYCDHGCIVDGFPGVASTLDAVLENKTYPDVVVALTDESDPSLDVQEIAELLSQRDVPFVEIKQGGSDEESLRTLRKVIQPLVENREDIFSTCELLSQQQAEEMLLHGFCHQSKFRERCPVCLLDQGELVHSTSFPVEFRGHVYFLSSEECRKTFMENPLRYIAQPSPPIDVKPKMALLGPPLAGKRTLAERLQRQNGCLLITMETLLASMMATDTALGEKVRAYLRNGRVVADQLCVLVLKHFVATHTYESNGWILLDFPCTVRQARLMEIHGVWPHKVFVLDTKDDIVKARNAQTASGDALLEMKLEACRYHLPLIIEYYRRLHDNVHVISGEFNRWRMFTDTEKIITENICRRRDYFTAIQEGRAAPIYGLGITPRIVKKRLSRFKRFCPVSLKDGELYESTSQAYAVEYREKFYHLANPEQMAAFIANPRANLAKKKLPTSLPVATTLREAESRNMVLEHEGYCPVALSRVEDGIDRFVPGDKSYLVRYDNKAYCFSSEEAMQSFQRRPWSYVGQRLPLKIPPKKALLSVDSLPLLGYLEQTVSSMTVDALYAVALFRPKYPHLSIRESTLKFLSIYMKAHNPKSEPHERAKYRRRLQEFKRDCSIIPFLMDALPRWDELPEEMRVVCQEREERFDRVSSLPVLRFIR